MTPRALITGISGQDGSYLAELLIGKGYEVWGASLNSALEESAIEQLKSAHPGRLKLRIADVNDANALSEVLQESKPSEIYNLAAQSHVGVALEKPGQTLVTNGLAVVTMLELLRTSWPTAKFFQASTSEIFGTAESVLQTESTPLSPVNPYAASKVYAHQITQIYRKSYGVFACCGILFSHESPRRSTRFVTRKMTHAAAAIATGRQEFVELGNLNSSRDWGFAGDFTDAMWRILQRDKADDYVVATGQSHTVREFCETAFRYAGMPLRWEGAGLDEVGLCESGVVRVKINPQFYRPVDSHGLCGDTSKAARELGWTPRHSFEDVVRMMVEADLAQATR